MGREVCAKRVCRACVHTTWGWGVRGAGCRVQMQDRLAARAHRARLARGATAVPLLLCAALPHGSSRFGLSGRSAGERIRSGAAEGQPRGEALEGETRHEALLEAWALDDTRIACGSCAILRRLVARCGRRACRCWLRLFSRRDWEGAWEAQRGPDGCCVLRRLDGLLEAEGCSNRGVRRS